MSKIDLSYLPHQNAVLHLPTFIKALVAGYGAGKSELICKRAIEHCYCNPGIAGAIVTPSCGQGEKTIIVRMTEILTKLGIPNKFMSTAGFWTIFGTRMWMFSGAVPNALKGPNLGWAAIDEPFIQKKEVFDIMLARVRHPDSTMRELLLAGTPEQMGWGFEILVQNPLPDASWIQAASYANPHLPDDTVSVLKNTYDEEHLRAYLEGEFVVITRNSAYYNFSDSIGGNVSNSVVYQPGLPLVLSSDFNVSPMCWDVLQHHQYIVPGTRGTTADALWVIDDLHLDSTNTPLAAEVFAERWQRHKGMFVVTGDYAGTASSTLSSLNNFDIITDVLAKRFGKERVELRVFPSPRVHMRLNITNGLLRNSNGERHLLFSPACSQTTMDFKQTKMKPGTMELDKTDPQRTHHSDAVGYDAVNVHFARMNN